MSERPSPDVSQTYSEQEEVIAERGEAYRELAERHEFLCGEYDVLLSDLGQVSGERNVAIALLKNALRVAKRGRFRDGAELSIASHPTFLAIESYLTEKGYWDGQAVHEKVHRRAG